MDAIELLNMIALGETSTVQFKRTLDVPARLAGELCAFANSEGGYLLVGVDDDQSIFGLDAESLRKSSTLIADVAANLIREPIYPISEVITIEGKNVLVVRVPESAGKPHFDQQGAIWVKTMGDKRRITSREELRRLFQETHVLYADEQLVDRTGLDDLDLGLVSDFLEQYYDQEISEGEERRILLENLNIMREGRLTLAGLLFFSRNPQKYRPEIVVKAVCFAGNEVTDNHYEDSENFDGVLMAQLAEALAFVQRNLRKVQNGKSFNTEGDWEIPRVVFEELLVNTLVHRNYFIASSPKLFIFQNRVEILSPGTLPNSLTVEQIKFGNSISRNPLIHAFASKLMPYRGIGTGIRRAIQYYPDMVFENDEATNSFRVILHRH